MHRVIEVHEYECNDCGRKERNDWGPPLGWSRQDRTSGEGRTRGYYVAELCPSCAKKHDLPPINKYSYGFM